MNLKKIRRLMKKYGLYCPIRQANPYRRMMKAMKTNNYASNKLNRNFKTNKPGEHLLTDITYIFYGKNRNLCYCSTIKDASTNEILAKEYSESLDVQFVLDTVLQLTNYSFIDFNCCLIHSDQGVHYTSIAFTSLLSKHSIILIIPSDNFDDTNECCFLSIALIKASISYLIPSPSNWKKYLLLSMGFS